MPKKQAKPSKAAEIPAVDLSHIAADLRPLAVPVSDLLFDPRNAKVHAEADLKAIAASLRQYGVRKPIVVRRDTRTVIAGNGQLQAAINNGWTHYPAVWVDDDDTTATGYAIADNRTSDLAEYNDALLQELLSELPADGLDADLVQMLTDLDAEIADYLDAGGSDPAEQSGSPTTSAPPEKVYRLLVTCRDENQQTELFQRLEDEGFTVQSQTSTK